MIASRSKYVHAFIVLDKKGGIIEATEKGIVRANISSCDPGRVTLRRYREHEKLNMKRLMKWLLNRERTSKGYDFIAWLGFATGIKELEDEDRWYCSELPYWIFQDNGCRLTEKDETFVFPDFFVRSDKFETVLY